MKVLSKKSIKAVGISLLFFLSSIGAAVLISPASASPGSPAPLAATPLTQLEANWYAGNGNAYNWDYNPQNQINSSNAQYLGLNWLFPLPTHPTALLSVSGGLGVDTSPLIINGTVYFVTQAMQVFALNAANGNVIWTTVLPILPNSTLGHGISSISLHLHDGNEAWTTSLFNHTPSFWVSAADQKIYALNAQNGKIELNFTDFAGILTVQGNNPVSIQTGTATNLLVDQQRGIVITSVMSGSSAATGRCVYRGWNVLVSPPTMIWESYCTPPQPGSNIAVNPNWDAQQIATMKGAYIFKGYGRDNPGGFGGPNGAVDLKALSASALNASLYNDWGYTQNPTCSAITGGASTGSTAAGWGSPWILGSGPTAGLAFVNTNNRDPYTSKCVPGPSLWSAAIMAINETNGKWVWGFQAAAHEVWDYDCSWWQAMGNETIAGVNTQVIWKTCKNGYLYELNSQTGALIWSWTPPTTIMARCHYCYMLDPLNSTEMSWPFFNPSLQATLCTPCSFAFESESAYSPTLNYLYTVSDNNPRLGAYVEMNRTNYATTAGMAFLPVPGQTATEGSYNNATAEAIDASTGKMVWSYYIPSQGYRGGMTTSGNILYLTLSSGDLLMVNAKTGALIKDYFIGGPLNVLTSVGATASGQMELIIPITAGILSWASGVPGDLVALTLQNIPTTSGTITSAGPSGTITTTTTIATTITASGTSGGFSSTTVYGIAAVAVIFIIATGYLAMTRGRKPAS